MNLLLIVVFVVAYAAIALEHPLGVNKSASALLGAGVLWTIYALATPDPHAVQHALSTTLVGTAQVTFFLMGAMTIVEVVDAHNGFEVITRHVRTRRLDVLMWLTSVVTFFLSAVLDNLTTTIVMVSLLRKIVPQREDRLLFVGITVIAANAGGAWSPVGDVTTTMLWVGGQISSTGIIRTALLASVVNMLVVLLVATRWLRGRVLEPVAEESPPPGEGNGVANMERNVMFFLGVGILVLVPAFKALTHLPPFLGVLFGLGILWLVGDVLHRKKDDASRAPLTLVQALSRIDLSSLMFFVGILLAVATLEHTHILSGLAAWLGSAVGSLELIVFLIGLFSAVVDNVPLVAASMAMYSVSTYPMDHLLWTLLAYCAGTGGSILIIGSAAGVAAMGMEDVTFTWYVRRISLVAFVGYVAGALAFLGQAFLGR